MYINASIKKYLDDLGARLPAPGGGSATALIAAVGTSLINMVCNFTLGKEKYKSVETDIRKILAKSRQLNDRFRELIDLDVEAFKSKDLDKSLEVPLEICRLSFEVANLCHHLTTKGNPNLITDVGCAIETLIGAFRCARFNVEINLKNILEKDKNKNIIQELARLEKEFEEIRLKVVKNVCEIIRRQANCRKD